MRINSKAAICVFLISLVLSASACSIIKPASLTTKMLVIPTANVPTATADTTRADTYLGDYVAQNGLFFAALEVQDPAKAETGANIKPGTQTMPAKVVIVK
jgi:hypothetical protein